MRVHAAPDPAAAMQIDEHGQRPRRRAVQPAEQPPAAHGQPALGALRHRRPAFREEELRPVIQPARLVQRGGEHDRRLARGARLHHRLEGEHLGIPAGVRGGHRANSVGGGVIGGRGPARGKAGLSQELHATRRHDVIVAEPPRFSTIPPGRAGRRAS